VTVPVRFTSYGQPAQSGVPVPRFVTQVRGAARAIPRSYLVSPDELTVIDCEDAVTSPITVPLNWAGQNR